MNKFSMNKTALFLLTTALSLPCLAGQETIIVYPVIPGTNTPDYGSHDRYIIKGNKIYEAIPGTTTPDYSTGVRVYKDKPGCRADDRRERSSCR